MFSTCAVHMGPLSGPLPRFHPHVVRHIPQLVTTFTSTHSIRDNFAWLDACPPKQSCHHQRPGRVFHPHMILRLVQHVLRHTSIHYTLDKPARLNTRIQNKNTGVKKKVGFSRRAARGTVHWFCKCCLHLHMLLKRLFSGTG